VFYYFKLDVGKITETGNECVIVKIQIVAWCAWNIELESLRLFKSLRTKTVVKLWNLNCNTESLKY